MFKKWQYILIFGLVVLLLLHKLAYQSIRNGVNRRTGDTTLDIKSFITPTNSDVKDLVVNITQSQTNSSDFSEYRTGLMKMYFWVSNGIDYNFDGMYPTLPLNPFEPIDWNHDSWQYPTETIALKRGDCEDQAILLCSMFRCFSNGTKPTECIVINGNIASHVAVQVSFSDRRLIIFDPTNNYFRR